MKSSNDDNDDAKRVDVQSEVEMEDEGKLEENRGEELGLRKVFDDVRLLLLRSSSISLS